jgi:hypothetical protein
MHEARMPNQKARWCLGWLTVAAMFIVVQITLFFVLFRRMNITNDHMLLGPALPISVPLSGLVGLYVHNKWLMKRFPD